MKLLYLMALLPLTLSLFAQESESKLYESHVYAKPLSGITIDGDVSDWPEESVSYPIKNKMWGDDVASSEDLNASFKVGYSRAENAIVMAIVIDDDDTVVNENPTWGNQDTYSFYVNEQYKIRGSGVVRYTIASNFKDATDPADNWDTMLEKYISWERLKYKIKTKDKRTTIELKYRLKDPIYAGRTIGAGHMIIDEDSDGGTALGWVGRGGKSSYSQPGRIGIVTFADNEQKTGILTGKVRWEDPEFTTKPEGIKVVSAENEAQWFYFPVDNEGMFSAKVPVGDWVLHPGMTVFFRDSVFHQARADKTKRVRVLADQTTDFENYILVPAPKPDLADSGNLLYEMDGNAKKKIDKAIREYMDYYQIEGVAFSAWKDGKVVYNNAYGVKNNYTREKVSPSTLFEVASITKPTFAFVVMRLVEKGIIDLDKPLYEDLSFDLIEGHEYAKLVTARHVLSHQTGFPNWANGKIDFSFKPGTSYGYSGEGFEYLKRVIEKITGKGMNQLLQEELIEPLGLKNFYFQAHPYLMKHKANGHYNAYTNRLDATDAPMVAFSLVTNPVDFMKFADAIHQRKGLKPETYELMFSKQNDVPAKYQDNYPANKEHVGLGWFIENTPYGQVIKHGGDNGDFRANFKLYDDLGLAFMITANGNTGHFLVNHIEKILIDPEVLKKRF